MPCLAETMAAGRRTRTSVILLEKTTRWFIDITAPHRSCPPRRANLPGLHPGPGSFGATVRGDQGPKSAPGRNAVHDSTGGVPAFVIPLLRTKRHRRGCPIAGRTRQETEGLIGFFVNTLVLRADLSNNPTFKELLRQVRETALEAYSHQDLPFEKLVEELHPDRHLSNSPLFQVMFVFQNTADRPLEFEQLLLNPIRTTSHSAKFDLTLSVSETNGTLRGSLNYNTGLFDGSTIERMLVSYKTSA